MVSNSTQSQQELRPPPGGSPPEPPSRDVEVRTSAGPPSPAQPAQSGSSGILRRQLTVSFVGLALFGSLAFNCAYVSWFDASATPLLASLGVVLTLGLALFAPQTPSPNDLTSWRRAANRLALNYAATERASRWFLVATLPAVVLTWLTGLGSSRTIRVLPGESDRIRYALWTGTAADIECKNGCSFRAWKLFFLSPPTVTCLPAGSLAAYSHTETAECPQQEAFSVLDARDEVDFSGWTPDLAHGTSKVSRTLTWVVRRNRTDNAPFEVLFGTSGPELAYELLAPMGASIERVEPSPNPPRKIYRVSVPASQMPTGIVIEVSYRIRYVDNFGLVTPVSDVRKCRNCDLSLRMPKATVRHYSLHARGLPAPYRLKKVVRLRSDSDVSPGVESVLLESAAGLEGFTDVETSGIPGQAKLSYYLSVGDDL